MPYEAPTFRPAHASLLRWYYGRGQALIFPPAIPVARLEAGLTGRGGTEPAYDPPDPDIIARFGEIDRALYRCTAGARVVLALAYGDEGEFWCEGPGANLYRASDAPPTPAPAPPRAPNSPRPPPPASHEPADLGRQWAVVALTATARAQAREASPEFWRAAFPFAGGEPPGGEAVRAWARGFAPRSRRSSRADAVRVRALREARGLLDDARDQFAAAHDARRAELRAVRLASIARASARADNGDQGR